MSSGIISRAISNIVEAHNESRPEGYTMVNVRPGEKVSAMLDVIAYLDKKTPSVVIADALSRKLASYAASSLNHADVILDAAELVISEYGIAPENSALGILQKEGFIKVMNPFSRDLDLGSGVSSHKPQKG